MAQPVLIATCMLIRIAPSQDKTPGRDFDLIFLHRPSRISCSPFIIHRGRYKTVLLSAHSASIESLWGSTVCIRTPRSNLSFGLGGVGLMSSFDPMERHAWGRRPHRGAFRWCKEPRRSLSFLSQGLQPSKYSGI